MARLRTCCRWDRRRRATHSDRHVPDVRDVPDSAARLSAATHILRSLR
jgi:hypothetical protein